MMYDIMINIANLRDMIIDNIWYCNDDIRGHYDSLYGIRAAGIVIFAEYVIYNVILWNMVDLI